MSGDQLCDLLRVAVRRGSAGRIAMTDRTDRLRERAHRIWEERGQPEGRELEHWHEAEEQLLHEGLDTESVREGGGEPVKVPTVEETLGASQQKPAPAKP